MGTEPDGGGKPGPGAASPLMSSSSSADQPRAAAADAAAPATSQDDGSGPQLDPGALASAPIKLEDLQPDVLYHVLLFLTQRDVAHLKMCSSRLRFNTLQACQHWAPKVESWLLSDPSRAALLRQLRGADPQLQHLAAANQQHPLPASMSSQAALRKQLQDAGLLPQIAQAAVGQQEAEHTSEQQPDAAEAQLQLQQPQQPNLVLSQKRLDWRQVWSCLERAQQGPWQLDVTKLAPAAARHGVVLTMEMLLQQPAPPPEAGACEQHAVGWRDNVPVITFVLDGKTVEIVVDASGRVTSPQRDWCQGCIQLVPGQPRLLALEVSYLLPVPAWFLHPCTLAAPRSSSSLTAAGSCGASSCGSSVSNMTIDHNWDSYSSATSTSMAGSTASSMSISQSAALCSAVPSGAADSSRSLATTSMTSSGSLGLCNSSTCSSCGNNSWSGRPRLSLDLSTGFGSYVSDPRCLDEAAASQLHRGLERLELAGRVCWRPNKVQAWLGRLLPGIRSHATGSVSIGGSGTSPGAGGTGSGLSAGSTGSGLKPVVKPSFAVSVSKAAAWQVPSDLDRRFAEGFMFWAVQHKLEQLLQHYGVLTP